MNYKEVYEKWTSENYFDEEFKAELRALTDEKEIEDRFYKDLEFGTAGMRGVIGAGRNTTPEKTNQPGTSDPNPLFGIQ